MSTDLRKDKRFLSLKKILTDLSFDYNVSTDEILALTEDISIPLNIFSTRLASFETIVKYLMENKGFSLTKTSALTKRSRQGVWQAMQKARKKYPEHFQITSSKYHFPISIITQEKLSVLESVVKYLKEGYSLSYAEIARIVNRDQRTVWTVYNRSRKK